MASRREQREYALQICFANFFDKDDVENTISHIHHMDDDELKHADGELTKRLVDAVCANAETYDKKIESKLKDWTIDRISTIDRMILRLAIAEFEECTDIPNEITINEMLELAKKYSTDKSKNFINGVLDALLKDKH